MNVVAAVLFITLSITAGVLTVCLTAPKPSMFKFQIDLQFKTHILSMLENFNLTTEYVQVLIRIKTYDKTH